MGYLLEEYSQVFTSGKFSPLIPSEHASLDVNLWESGDVRILIFRNRSGVALPYKNEFEGNFYPFFGSMSGEQFTIAANDVGMLVLDKRPEFEQIKSQFHGINVEADIPTYIERTPIPAGNLKMHVSHKKRESGCHPFGSDRYTQWGWYYEDIISHHMDISVERFRMKKTAVTNAE